jgi:hypothetical protein
VNAQAFNQWEKNVQQPVSKHGLTATAATVLLLDATTVNILDKLHLKAAPILFDTVPISMPFSLVFSSDLHLCSLSAFYFGLFGCPPS